MWPFGIIWLNFTESGDRPSINNCCPQLRLQIQLPPCFSTSLISRTVQPMPPSQIYAVFRCPLCTTMLMEGSRGERKQPSNVSLLKKRRLLFIRLFPLLGILTYPERSFRCLQCDFPAPQRRHPSTSASPFRDLSTMPPAMCCHKFCLEH